MELRGYAGTVTFHNASLSLFPQVAFEAAGPNALRKINSSALALTAATAPTSPLPLALDATIVAHPTHVRVDGRVSLAAVAAADGDSSRISLPESAAGDDHAVTVRFSVPVDGAGWTLGLDADTSSVINASGLPAGGRRSRGYYDGAGEEVMLHCLLNCFNYCA
jgi:hypothetical protein